MDQTEFTSKIEAVMNNRPVIRDNQINYSVGYVHGTAQDESTLRNRLVDTGAPMYVNMKITRMQGTNRIIIGVSIIDAQMKQRELAEKLTKENQTAGRRQKMAGEKLRKNRKKA